MSAQIDESILLADEILDSEEAFMVLAALFKGARSLEQIADATGLPADVAADLTAIMTEIGIVKPTKARASRFALQWKPFTKLFVDAAVGMDTEIAIMVEAYEDSGEGAFEQYAATAGRRVDRFERDLVGSPEFRALLKDYLVLLVDEFLVDDPRLYDTTLLDAAVAFESLLAKVGPDAFKRTSKRSPRLLELMRSWGALASSVNMLGEVALAETLDARGILRK
jgi:hypothetical protein